MLGFVRRVFRLPHAPQAAQRHAAPRAEQAAQAGRVAQADAARNVGGGHALQQQRGSRFELQVEHVLPGRAARRAYLLEGDFVYEHGGGEAGDYLCEQGGIAHVPKTGDNGLVLFGMNYGTLHGFVDADRMIDALADSEAGRHIAAVFVAG